MCIFIRSGIILSFCHFNDQLINYLYLLGCCVRGRFTLPPLHLQRVQINESLIRSQCFNGYPLNSLKNKINKSWETYLWLDWDDVFGLTDPHEVLMSQ